MLEALGFFAVVEVVGLAAAPLAAVVFGRLPGAGLGLAKPFGLLLVGWLVWMAGSLGIAGYGPLTIVVALVLMAAAGALAALRQRALARRLGEETPEPPRGRLRRWRRGRLLASALPAEDPERVRLLAGAEAVFAVSFAAMALLVSFAPDVWNTEKPMDMAFMNAIEVSSSFPPDDPWMAGETINYYYLGHLLLGMPAHLLGLAPGTGYNLALAALFALSATAVFTVAGTLWAAARVPVAGGSVGTGLAAVALCLVLGNLAGAKEWLDADAPPRGYDWFAPSRVIEDTINEFPAFSFNLGDLHAHLLAIPFTVLALAFALQVALHGPRGDVAWRSVAEALAAGLAVGVLYAINSWSYPVAAGLLVLGVVVWMRGPEAEGRRAFGAVWTGLVLLASVVLVLPFWLEFDPAARGVGAVTEHLGFSEWAGDTALIYGILGWALVAAYVSRLLAARLALRVAVWSAIGAAFVLSALAPLDLAGIAVLAAALAVAVHALLSRRLAAPERFLWAIVAAGVGCVLAPELVYVRDEFDGGDLYRMNTVFKLGFQAYLLLALAAACALPWAGHWLPRRAWTAWASIGAVLLLLGLIYPYAGNYARRDGFASIASLDGLDWLRDRAPGDVAAIDWLRTYAGPSAVVLEAVGPDYSAFGHGRISTFTGRPTVLGWSGHEVQWRHDPGRREEDVRTLYTTSQVGLARELLDRYGISYVVVGPIERADYGSAGLAKWDRLGRRVFDRDGTTIWEVAQLSVATARST
jgi:YYY domain-containing protein